jgi:hypothetical protein
MEFDLETIRKMNEQTVREEIIAPIISKLGYRFGSTNYVEREEQLPDLIRQIGRASSKDYPIGRPDYLCGVDGRRGSFVVEAKSGHIEITKEEIFQAHSYASHGLMNAKFFVVCNGVRMKVYETAGGVEAEPLVDLEFHNFYNEYYKLEALLSPNNLTRHANILYDITKPLGTNLGSLQTIKYGWANFSNCRYEILNHPAGTFAKFLASIGRKERFDQDMAELLTRRQPIIDGTVRRNPNGKIEAYMEFDSTLEWISQNMVSMGISKLMFTTDADELSVDVDQPTIFESLSNASLPVGLELRQPLTAEFERLGVPVELTMNFRAVGAFSNKQFAGEYVSYSLMNFGVGLNSIPLLCEYSGEFVLTVH